MIENLAFGCVILLSNDICYCTSAQKQCVPVVGAESTRKKDFKNKDTNITVFLAKSQHQHPFKGDNDITLELARALPWRQSNYLPLVAFCFASLWFLYEEEPGPKGPEFGFSFFIVEGMMCSMRPWDSQATRSQGMQPLEWSLKLWSHLLQYLASKKLHTTYYYVYEQCSIWTLRYTICKMPCERIPQQKLESMTQYFQDRPTWKTWPSISARAWTASSGIM